MRRLLRLSLALFALLELPACSDSPCEALVKDMRQTFESAESCSELAQAPSDATVEEAVASCEQTYAQMSPERQEEFSTAVDDFSGCAAAVPPCEPGHEASFEAAVARCRDEANFPSETTSAGDVKEAPAPASTSGPTPCDELKESVASQAAHCSLSLNEPTLVQYTLCDGNLATQAECLESCYWSATCAELQANSGYFAGCVDACD